ncbi:MAG: RNA methyltransferase [Oscillospiraceae bacterium]|nr:RNA methyltransferase [Oscillospiraceae bacterium]
MEFKFITSRDNPLIKEYIKLRDNKKYRTKEQKFVLEGARLTVDAAKSGVALEGVFITEEALEKYFDDIELLKTSSNERIYLISDKLAGMMEDTKNSQGIFSVVGVLDKNLGVGKIKTGSRFAVLDGLQDPGNVGTILRVSDAVGLDGVFLCDCCDVYNPKTIRSTMGSIFRVPFRDDLSFPEAAQLLHDCGVVLYATVVDPDAESIRETIFCGSSCVVIGNEGNGLSDEDVALCNKRITIKMNGSIESLNAATAAAITLWEMTK